MLKRPEPGARLVYVYQGRKNDQTAVLKPMGHSVYTGDVAEPSAGARTYKAGVA